MTDGAGAGHCVTGGGGAGGGGSGGDRGRVCEGSGGRMVVAAVRSGGGN